MINPDYATDATPAFRAPLQPSLTRQPNAALWILMLIVWGLAAVGMLAAISVSVGLVAAPALGSGMPLCLMLLLILLAALLTALRRRRRGAVLAYVEQAMRLNLPLPVMLRAAEQSESRATAMALRRVRLELEGGQTINEAVARALPGTPLRTLGLIASGERSGRLPKALRRLTHESTTRFEGGPGNDLYLRWYPPVLALICGFVITMICVFVMPKFEAIFQDFRIELPPITVTVVRSWQFLAVPVSLVVLSATLIYLGRVMAAIFAPEMHARGPWRWFVDRLKWYTPIIASPTRARSLGDACYVLADALEAGRPLDWALTEASRSGTNDVLAERLAVWADHARAGHPAAESARRAEMPPLLIGMLRTAGGAELSELFRYIAGYYDSRFARSAIILQAVFVPLLSIVMGALVGTVVYALFMPMMQLINSMLDGMSGMPGRL